MHVTTELAWACSDRSDIYIFIAVCGVIRTAEIPKDLAVG